MAQSVQITTPIPTLEEFGKSLGLSKTRQKSLINLVREGSANREFNKTSGGSGRKKKPYISSTK